MTCRAWPSTPRITGRPHAMNSSILVGNHCFENIRLPEQNETNIGGTNDRGNLLPRLLAPRNERWSVSVRKPKKLIDLCRLPRQRTRIEYPGRCFATRLQPSTTLQAMGKPKRPDVRYDEFAFKTQLALDVVFRNIRTEKIGFYAVFHQRYLVGANAAT